MLSELECEKLVRLYPDGAALFPKRNGKLQSRATMYRRVEEGLEVWICGGVMHTSREAVLRYIAKQTADRLPQGPEPIEKKTHHQARLARAEARLKSRGIIPPNQRKDK